jgi:hypothetical protein
VYECDSVLCVHAIRGLYAVDSLVHVHCYYHNAFIWGVFVQISAVRPVDTSETVSVLSLPSFIVLNFF